MRIRTLKTDEMFRERPRPATRGFYDDDSSIGKSEMSFLLEEDEAAIKPTPARPTRPLTRPTPRPKKPDTDSDAWEDLSEYET